MRYSALNSSQAMAQELGARLKQARLNQNKPQEVLAKEAGVTRYIIQTLENGKGSMGDLMAVLVALGLTEQLDNLLPEQKVSPIEIFRLKGKGRQRASGDATSKNNSKLDKEEDLGW